MYKNRTPKKIKPPVSAAEQQMIERQFAAAVKPKRLDWDKEFYFRAEFHCPICGQYLAAYTYGRAMTTPNGLAEYKRTDCSCCGKKIDWSDVPLPTRETEG